jgi:hypothetical protein
LSDAAKAQLDKIAKAMADRPSLKLTVTGAARLDQAREGYQRERLHALMAAERRAGDDAAEAAAADTAASNAAMAASAPAAAASDTDYPQLLRRLYRRTDIPGKPRNLIGMTKDVPVAQMKSLLLAHISVSDGDIRQLAIQRAVAVKNYLLAQHLSADRVFIGAAKTEDADNAARGAAPASAAEPASGAGAAAPTALHWTPHAELGLGMR